MGTDIPINWKKIRETEDLLDSVMTLLKCNESELLQKLEKLQTDITNLENKLSNVSVK